MAYAPSNSPRVWWRHNDASGTVAADSSGNGNNGVYEPGTPSIDFEQASIIGSGDGKSILTNLDTEYVKRTSASTTGSVTTCSIQTNFKPTNLAGLAADDMIVQAGDSGVGNATLYIDVVDDGGTKKYRALVYDSSGTAVTGPAIVQDVWVHLVATYDKATGYVYLYVNGTQYTSAGTYTITNTFGDLDYFWVGRHNSISTRAAQPGYYQDSVLWDIALSSAQVSAEYAALSGAPPTAPSGCSASYDGTKVTVSWTDNSADETGFRVERQEGTGSWVQVGQVAANSTSFLDYSVVPGYSYTYRVRAYNAYGDSSSCTTTEVAVGNPVVYNENYTWTEGVLAVLQGVSVVNETVTWTEAIVSYKETVRQVAIQLSIPADSRGIPSNVPSDSRVV